MDKPQREPSLNYMVNNLSVNRLLYRLIADCLKYLSRIMSCDTRDAASGDLACVNVYVEAVLFMIYVRAGIWERWPYSPRSSATCMIGEKVSACPYQQIHSIWNLVLMKFIGNFT